MHSRAHWVRDGSRIWQRYGLLEGRAKGKICEVGQSPLLLCSGLWLGLVVGTGDELVAYLQAAEL